MFTNAIACTPSPSIIDGITYSSLGKPFYPLAIEQHTKYVETLEQLGLKVQILPEKEMFPDSTFIEDVALCTPPCAIITGLLLHQDAMRYLVYMKFFQNIII